MKGQITVYYDLPNLALYLERVGNKVMESDVQDIIAEMLKQAVALHMNEEADIRYANGDVRQLRR